MLSKNVPIAIRPKGTSILHKFGVLGEVEDLCSLAYISILPF